MRRSLAAVLATIAVAALFAGTGVAGAEGPAAAPPEIIGGTPANPGELPYQVALVFTDTPGIPIRGQFCGGSLISPDTVLTAAHCVVSDFDIFGDDIDHLHVVPILEDPRNIQVIAGTTDLGANGGGERLAVRRVRVDPHFTVSDDLLFGTTFDANTFSPDIAILELAHDSTATPVELATPAQQSLYPGGTPAVVSGWGAVDALGGPPTILQRATLPIVSDEDCAVAYGSDVDAARNVCAGGQPPDGLPSACYGDSGGPLVVDDAGTPLQVGVVVGGDGCGAPERPNVFTEVAANQGFVGRYLDPDEVPDAPRHLTLAQRNDTVRVSWDPPEFDGGTRITGYKVKVGQGPAVAVGPRVRHLDVDIIGIEPFRPVRVSVRAVNAVGTGGPRVRSFVPRPIVLQ